MTSFSAQPMSAGLRKVLKRLDYPLEIGVLARHRGLHALEEALDRRQGNPENVDFGHDPRSAESLRCAVAHSPSMFSQRAATEAIE